MAQDHISAPPTRGPVDVDGKVSTAWVAWFAAVFQACFALYQSGTTAQRPTKGLWIGRPYFDADLGTPIWHDGNGSTGWCDSGGNAV